MNYNIPELIFVSKINLLETYIMNGKGFKPMILTVHKPANLFQINEKSYFYKEDSEITKAVYDFQNEHIEKGYKEDALLFRKLKNSNYKSLVEKMLNILDEKKELSWDKINSQYVGKSDPNQTSTLKKEVQDGLGNYFDNSSLSTENYNAEPFMKQQGFAYYRSENGCPVWDITRIGCLIYSPETVKQITPNIQHIITPSKNYFLFKLSK